MRHRGLSHSVPLWTGVTAAAVIGNWNSPALLKYGTIAACLGVLMHLLEDAFSIMGVPVWGHKSIAFRVYKTGRVSEFIVVVAVAGVSLIYTVLLYHRLNYQGLL